MASTTQRSFVETTEQSTTPRGIALREQVLRQQPSISDERLGLITEVYQSSPQVSPALLRARTLERILRFKTIYILENELVVGNQAPRPRCAELFPEFSVQWILDELDDFDKRDSDAFQVDAETKERIRNLLPWWRGRTVQEQAVIELAPEGLEAHKELVYILTSLSSGVGHISVDYERAITRGVRSIAEEAAARSQAAAVHAQGVGQSGAGIQVDGDSLQREIDFFEAVQVVCNALVEFANRFARLAQGLAEAETNPQRRVELEEIARVCRRVPEYPARTFQEAVQAFWFVHLVLQIESNGHSISPGRFDQYLYPYFRDDLASGAVTRERARELIENVWVKLNEIVKLRDRIGSKAFGGYPMFQNLIIGGVDRQGRDAVNELSFLCLEVTRDLGMPQPSLSVRWHSATRRDFLNAAMELVKVGIGMPAFFNDEVIIPLLLDIGCTLEDARNYAEVGCVEPQAPGKTEGYYPAGFLNLAKVLELTLCNGHNPITGSTTGLRTGEDFSRFDDFYRAYLRQLDYFCGLQAAAVNVIDSIHGRMVPTPFCSCFVDDCLSTGTDIRCGGARYNYTSPNAVAIANVADSLVAVKYAVFEEAFVSYPELLDALRADFVGYEPLRQRLLNRYPKYGNDCEEVDRLASDVALALSRTFRDKANWRGGCFHIGLQSISSHALFVNVVGATPDGRRRSMLLTDGGCSPAQGRDQLGPTAILKSVACIDQYRIPNGTLLNIKLHPSLINGEHGADSIASLIESYFMMKGQHIQFNVVSTETLREAQRNPERYGSLVVRVAGFSVFFVSLDRVLQEDIIQRTEYA